MKTAINRTLIFTLLICFNVQKVEAQEWEWNDRAFDEKIQEFITGTIQDMDTQKDCTNYKYGKAKYQKIDVLSYSYTPTKVHFEFKFSWRIDFVFTPSKDFSFTIKVSVSKDGCNARATYIDESGKPDCKCNISDSFDLGCIYAG